MPSNRFRARVIGAALLAALAGASSARPVAAADRPATPEGAQMLRDFFGRFLPANASALVSVKPEGSDYLVSIDLGALNPLLKAAGARVTYEPATVVYKATEQDDGKWRVVLDSLPKIASSAGDMRSSVEFTNFRQTLLIDPAIAWFVSGSANSDKGVVETHAPKLDQTIDFGPFHADAATVVNADGSVSTTVKEDFSDIGLKTSVVDKNDAPANISGRLKKALLNVAIDGLKTSNGVRPPDACCGAPFSG